MNPEKRGRPAAQTSNWIGCLVEDNHGGGLVHGRYALERAGDELLQRGYVVAPHEGETFEERLVLLEFPDGAAAEAWYNDPDYQDASKLRRASSRSLS